MRMSLLTTSGLCSILFSSFVLSVALIINEIFILKWGNPNEEFSVQIQESCDSCRLGQHK